MMKNKIFILVYYTLFIISIAQCLEGSDTRKTVVDVNEKDVIINLTDVCRYDKFQRPVRKEKTIVYVHLHVYSLESIDSQNLRYTTQVLLRYRWKDPRLIHETYLKFEGGQMLDRIWSPHLYIVNEQNSRVMGSSHRDMLLSIWPDGTVVQLSRIKVTLGCSMNFQKFPFDSQKCPLIMESWSYNASQLKLMWEEVSPVTFNEALQLPEYSLEDISVNSSIARYDQQGSTNLAEHIDVYYGKAAKNFSTLLLYFEVQRQYGFYMMDYYMPSILIVAVSWVSFWLDANSVPGRTILGTSTLLTFITLSRNIGTSLPKVSYIKSSEIWFIGCCVFIFGSLVEFAFVNIIWRRKKNVELEKVTGKHILQSTLTPQLYHRHLLHHSHSESMVSSITESHFRYNVSTHPGNSKSFNSLNSDHCLTNGLQYHPSGAFLELEQPIEDTSKSVFMMTPQEIANWIDRRSRILFPVCFLIFNCLYWTWTLVLF